MMQNLIAGMVCPAGCKYPSISIGNGLTWCVKCWLHAPTGTWKKMAKSFKLFKVGGKK